MAYAHRGDSNAVEFTYDGLDRLAVAEYNITDESNEVFTIDDLGNRELVNVRDGSNVYYEVDANTNRYDSIGGHSLAYNSAGDLTIDKDAYKYQYDYENRITKVLKSGPVTVAEYAYDALGRRIKKTDSIAGQSTVYYYNDKWQVLCEYGGRNWATMLQWFAYGNYVDEPLIKGKQNDETPQSVYLHLYVQDHLYSTVALVQRYQLNLLERYEYDAYGNCQIMNASYNPRSSSSYANPYYFTGRDMDTLDGGNLKVMNYRHRYYDTYTGRFFTHDCLGITPNPQWPNRFTATNQYTNGLNLYEYVGSNSLENVDPFGLVYFPPPPGPMPAEPLRALDCPYGGCPDGWLDPLPSGGIPIDWHEENAFAQFVGRLGDVEFSHRSVFAQRLAKRPGFYEWGRGPKVSGGIKDQLMSRGEYYAYNLTPCNCTCFGYSHSGVTYGWAITEDDGVDRWAYVINICKSPTDPYCDLSYTVRCCVKKTCLDGTYAGELVCRVRFDMKDKYSFDVSGWPPARYFGKPFWHIIHFDKTLDATISLH